MNAHDDPADAADLRRRAEAQFQRAQAASAESLAAMSPVEIQRALHELHVHQIELEMQNEELRRTRVELDLTRDRYVDLFDLAPVGYCTISAGGLILEANLTAATLLGIARRSLLKRPFVSFIIAADQDCFHLLRRKLSQTGVSEACELRLLHKGGLPFWAQLETALTLDAEESPLCRVVFSDASERKLGEEALRKALSQADAANQAKSQFLSTMSHEIRTPLNGVIGLTDLLLQSDLTPAQAELAKVVQDCGHGLLAVIGDVLDLAKIEAGNQELVIEEFELRRLTDEILGMFTATAVTKGLRLVIRVDPAVPERARGEAVRLRQVLINLVGNALKFTDHGSVTLAVTVISADAQRIWIQWDVSDTGPGMADEFRTRLFQPFTQADSTMTRKHGGTGLGLAIAKRLTDLLGGGLTVDTQLGQGSCFHCTIPLQPASDAAATIARPGEPITLPAWGSAPSVLVVEDDATSQFTLDLMLTELGCPHQLAENGTQAIAAVAAGAFDLVLMDCQMPGCDGYTATRVIREQAVPGLRRLPIIALTANVFTEDRDRCRHAGMDDFLAKPCSLQTLKNCLLRWTGDRR